MPYFQHVVFPVYLFQKHPVMPFKKQVFISYNYDIDRHYKNLLVAWNNNSHFKFEMRDHSADTSVHSMDETVIKRTISAKINRGKYFIVLIGKTTCKCPWVKWEIEKAKELKKKIIAVKLDRTNKTPDELYGVGAAWAYSFKLESITNAIKKV